MRNVSLTPAAQCCFRLRCRRSSSFTDSAFEENEAGEVGGAIHSYESHMALTNCTFEGNYAEGDGGGLRVSYASEVHVNGSVLAGNRGALPPALMPVALLLMPVALLLVSACLRSTLGDFCGVHKLHERCASKRCKEFRPTMFRPDEIPFFAG